MPITIVMYHYVRPIRGSSYPGIKGLELEAFEGQLDYLLARYRPVSVADLVAAAAGEAPLPERALLLTFDDGFRDHADFVAPRLAARGVSGAFYPPSSAVLERRLLDVHKLQHLLAVAEDPRPLVEAIEAALAEAEGVESPEAYRERLWKPSRYDPPEVMFVKGMLQHALPPRLREQLTDALFREHVTDDVDAFADALYMSEADLKELIAQGMHVGAHGHDHLWLEHVSAEDQRREVERSRAMLAGLDPEASWFSFCYPYGSYDDRALQLLSELGFSIGFTTRVGLARPAGDRGWLTLPRLDTNDFPTDPEAPANRWVEEALA